MTSKTPSCEAVPEPEIEVVREAVIRPWFRQVESLSGWDDVEALDDLARAIARHLRPGALTFRQLQAEQRAWVAHNFPDREVYYPLLGAVEELGELAHAHLKQLQGIRGTAAEHEAAAQDAVADAIIYLSDYCSARGFDLQALVETTWARVKQRDWKKDRLRGGEAA